MEKMKLFMDNAIQSVTQSKDKTIQFFTEAKAELKKVTWPTRQQTLASTAVVMVIVAVMALYLGIIDLILAKLIKFILG